MTSTYNNKIIFFDIDNTLVDSRTGRVPDSAVKALEMLSAAGYKIGIASGRLYTALPKMIVKMRRWDVCITSNGQYIHGSDGKLLNKITISHEALKQCLAIANRTDTPLEVKTETRRYLINSGNSLVQEVYKFFHVTPPKEETYEEKEDIVALMAFRMRGSTYDDFAAISGISVYPGICGYADLNVEGCSKYTGIMQYIKNAGYDGYIAVGDSMNDYEMLENADFAVAMGNAEPELLSVADFKTDRVEQNGILQAAEYILSRL